MLFYKTKIVAYKAGNMVQYAWILSQRYDSNGKLQKTYASEHYISDFKIYTVQLIKESGMVRIALNFKSKLSMQCDTLEKLNGVM